MSRKDEAKVNCVGTGYPLIIVALIVCLGKWETVIGFLISLKSRHTHFRTLVTSLRRYALA